jgi:NAD(P)-dependent dehydrogenase (short-subunit alcohol dehydrogenase family)
MASKTLLITGGNIGLGFEIIKALWSSDEAYQILLGGRSLHRAEDAAKKALTESTETRSRIQAVQVNIEDNESIEALYQQVTPCSGLLIM